MVFPRLLDPAPFAALAVGLWIVELPSFCQVPSRGIRCLGLHQFGVGEVERADCGAQGRAWYGMGDVRSHRRGGKAASAGDACGGGHGEETAPRRIAWREHYGVVD